MPSEVMLQPVNEVVGVINPTGTGPLVLICEHASNFIPEEYRHLGLHPRDRVSHAAWDPGALSVAKLLSAWFDAPLIFSKVSRLVYDCNRPPEAESAMPERTERIVVPGNKDLSSADKAVRIEGYYKPFCRAVNKVLDDRAADTVVATIHSFTPVFNCVPRKVEIGILHDDDRRLADAMLAASGLVLPNRRIQRNAPYGPQDGVTHSLKLHAKSRGLANVMIELRNDLLVSETQTEQMAQDVRVLLEAGLGKLRA